MCRFLIFGPSFQKQDHSPMPYTTFFYASCMLCVIKTSIIDFRKHPSAAQILPEIENVPSNRRIELTLYCPPMCCYYFRLLFFSSLCSGSPRHRHRSVHRGQGARGAGIPQRAWGVDCLFVVGPVCRGLNVHQCVHNAFSIVLLTSVSIFFWRETFS